MEIIRPDNPLCQKVYRQIQAHCAIRLSARVGHKLRAIVGATGDITSLNAGALATKFSGNEYTESLRLLGIANHIKKRYSRGDNHGE